LSLPPFAVAALIALLSLLLGVCGFFLARVYTKVEEGQKAGYQGRIEIRDQVQSLKESLDDDMHQTRGMIYSKLDTIKEGVQIINNRVGKLETWKEEHVKVDERDHAEAVRRMDDQHERLAMLERRRLHPENRKHEA
jgi:hypothetical protein